MAATLLPTLVRTSLALELAHPQTKWQGTRKDKGWEKGAIDALPDLKIQPASHLARGDQLLFERRELLWGVMGGGTPFPSYPLQPAGESQ